MLGDFHNFFFRRGRVPKYFYGLGSLNPGEDTRYVEHLQGVFVCDKYCGLAAFEHLVFRKLPSNYTEIKHHITISTTTPLKTIKLKVPYRISFFSMVYFMCNLMIIYGRQDAQKPRRHCSTGFIQSYDFLDQTLLAFKRVFNQRSIMYSDWHLISYLNL